MKKRAKLHEEIQESRLFGAMVASLSMLGLFHSWRHLWPPVWYIMTMVVSFTSSSQRGFWVGWVDDEGGVSTIVGGGWFEVKGDDFYDEYFVGFFEIHKWDKLNLFPFLYLPIPLSLYLKWRVE